jgi:hypothetical protein
MYEFSVAKVDADVRIRPAERVVEDEVSRLQLPRAYREPDFALCADRSAATECRMLPRRRERRARCSRSRSRRSDRRCGSRRRAPSARAAAPQNVLRTARSCAPAEWVNPAYRPGHAERRTSCHGGAKNQQNQNSMGHT